MLSAGIKKGYYTWAVIWAELDNLPAGSIIQHKCLTVSLPTPDFPLVARQCQLKTTDLLANALRRTVSVLCRSIIFRLCTVRLTVSIYQT